MHTEEAAVSVPGTLRGVHRVKQYVGTKIYKHRRLRRSKRRLINKWLKISRDTRPAVAHDDPARFARARMPRTACSPPRSASPANGTVRLQRKFLGHKSAHL